MVTAVIEWTGFFSYNDAASELFFFFLVCVCVSTPVALFFFLRCGRVGYSWNGRSKQDVLFPLLVQQKKKKASNSTWNKKATTNKQTNTHTHTHGHTQRSEASFAFCPYRSWRFVLSAEEACASDFQGCATAHTGRRVSNRWIKKKKNKMGYLLVFLPSPLFCFSFLVFLIGTTVRAAFGIITVPCT